jgi:hypothetical protein
MKKPIILEKADIKNYVTIPGAAEMTGYKQQTMRNYIYEEKLQPYKFLDVTLLKISDLKKLNFVSGQ